MEDEMSKSRVTPWILGSLLTLSLLLPTTSTSGTRDTYPQKSINIIVAFAAGGGTDVVARVVAKFLSAELKVPVNVVNMPGGNQITGTLAVLESPPDGYTLLLDQPATSAAHATVKNLPYKLEERTFGPMWGGNPQAFVVNGKSPWNSLRDVLEAAKKEPGTFTLQRAGGTSFNDFCMVQLLRAGNVDVSKAKFVDFAGGGPALTSLAGGHIKLASSGAGSVLPLAQSGLIKVLAVTGDTRLAILPNVPSAVEAGFPGLNLISWYSISGPKGLPGPVLERLDTAIKKITQDAAFAKEMEALGGYPRYTAAAQMRDFVLTQEVKTYRELAAAALTTSAGK
jgi:tripartite-type tricarboxylate transporter receptor subunit TctC